MTSKHSTAIVNTTTKFSFSVQCLVAIISVHGLIIAYNESNQKQNSIERQHEFRVLFDLLALETFFQLIEFSFYFYFVTYGINLNEMALTRYYDWVFTTPAMLISFAYYFAYLNGYRKRLSEFVYEEQTTVFCIIISNFFMLLTGYICEARGTKISCDFKMILQSFGFFFLVMTFQLLYPFAKTTSFGLKIFQVTFIIWFCYGIAFSLDESSKNSMYNILDLFSKNFFSFFVYANILYKQHANTK